ncbi:MAG: IS4 family transposase, partial [Ruminobacter sp.]|nr:IS4 family transposase [Ruminobacter sp.]
MKSLYSKLLRDGLLNTKKEILGSVEVRSKKENIPLKIMFVRNRNDINRYICLLSTDITLTEEEIIRTYARRWSIEVSFYNQKQF